MKSLAWTVLILCSLFLNEGCRSTNVPKPAGQPKPKTVDLNLACSIEGVALGTPVSTILDMQGEPRKIEREYNFAVVPIHYGQVSTVLDCLDGFKQLTQMPVDGLEQFREFFKKDVERLQKSGQLDQYMPLNGGAGPGMAPYDPSANTGFREAIQSPDPATPTQARVYVDKRPPEEILSSMDTHKVADELQENDLVALLSLNPNRAHVGYLFRVRFFPVQSFPQKNLKVVLNNRRTELRSLIGRSLTIKGKATSTLLSGISRQELLATELGRCFDTSQTRARKDPKREVLVANGSYQRLTIVIEDGLVKSFRLDDPRAGRS